MRADTHILIHDITREHEARMLHLRRYYPFFELFRLSLNQYAEGHCHILDMGYMTMAVLRWLIEENSFNDRRVTYADYRVFLRQLLLRDFDYQGTEEEQDALIQYVFDKLTNEGRPFYFEWYDPMTKQRCTGKTQLIESGYEEGEIRYAISADGIEFYLDTKETKDESVIGTEQILLSKMIKARNFKGGAEVIRRINSEVTRLLRQKDEILKTLSINIFEGLKELEHFQKAGLSWFEEEQKQFDQNLKLVDQALKKAREEKNDSRAMTEIYQLNLELKRAMQRHEQLLAACTALQVRADEALMKARHHQLRQSFDFRDWFNQAIALDDATIMEQVMFPFNGLNFRKTMPLERMDDLLNLRSEDKEEAETVGAGETQEIIYEDELIDERIRHNHSLIAACLFDALIDRKVFSLAEFNYLLTMKYTDIILNNGDYYSFLSQLAQKDYYDLSALREEQDTFLEKVMAGVVKSDHKKVYEDLKFSLTFISDEEIQITDDRTVTNIRFERTGI